MNKEEIEKEGSIQFGNALMQYFDSKITIQDYQSKASNIEHWVQTQLSNLFYNK